MLTNELIKKIEEFVYSKPRSVQEIAQLIGKNWRTADRYISEIEKNFVHMHGKIIYLYSVPESYINHSSHPNTTQDLKNKCDIAARNINKGEELTTDYSINAPPHAKMKCLCGSGNCRKSI